MTVETANCKWQTAIKRQKANGKKKACAGLLFSRLGV
jgi:hypothetical protein